MKISVIIPTYNGAHKIMGVLRSLEQQDLMPDEIIVVVDGSTDGTAEMLKNQNLGLPRFKIVQQPNGGRAQVRNRGAKEATGDLLIFLDDDMVLPKESIFFHHQHHIELPKCLMSGRLKDPNENSDDDFLRFKSWLNDKWERMKIVDDKGIECLSRPFLTAGNFSVQKNVFEELNGFDERLTDNEDYDLAVRAKAKGIPIYTNQKAFAWHNDVVSCIGYIKRLREYSNAHYKLLKLNPDLLKGERPAFPPQGLKIRVFNFFANRFWIDCIEKKRLSWIPENIRFKLYDIIVTANGSFYPEKVNL